MSASLVPGTVNFRDVGGIPVVATPERCGGVISGRRLYRSDALSAIGPAGRSRLIDLGVRTIIDLRDAAEVAAMPDDTVGLDIETHQLPILSGALTSLVSIPSVSVLYADLINSSAEEIAGALQLIVDAPVGGVLVHCTAGKDRTGVVVAVALLVTGADPAFVVSDYAATEGHLRGAWACRMESRAVAAGIPLSPELRTMLVASPPEAMRETIDRMVSTSGSVAAYLEGAGLSLDAQRRLRNRLLE
ncbi:hypothetical protein AX769_02445 [Frondihabitans sp. PAMC 28766]|uniref:tyrosine-protein phosphatase n=1 Tax=Frondihabitans sp. PAMC 28766 TaxID=1795630 RepID=UPI00078CF76F|nr:tyrosine-protein phosphatase [Frondihabitans sp. PAMC 28766]AMM19199.1 hypothetical protein AX769_02445 [Frondihabitans sp. PAMC 28766]